MRFASPRIDRDCLIGAAPFITEEGLQQIANGIRVVPVDLLTPEAEDLCERKPEHVGCSGDCYQGRRCTCSPSMAWRAPRIRTRRPLRPRRVFRDLVRWLLNPRAW